MDKPETLSFRWRHLPHWMVDNRPYFVTMRLKNTLPASVVWRLREEREALERSGADEKRLLECERRQFVKIETILDHAEGEGCLLQNPEIAHSVLDSFEWLEREHGWVVFAVTVMPNHVHVLLQNTHGRGAELSRDLGAVKSFTAKRANKLLERSGHFWQDENFDHWVRDEKKFEASVRYIASNPVKAGLARHWADWPWTRLTVSFQ